MIGAGGNVMRLQTGRSLFSGDALTLDFERRAGPPPGVSLAGAAGFPASCTTQTISRVFGGDGGRVSLPRERMRANPQRWWRPADGSSSFGGRAPPQRFRLSPGACEAPQDVGAEFIPSYLSRFVTQAVGRKFIGARGFGTSEALFDKGAQGRLVKRLARRG